VVAALPRLRRGWVPLLVGWTGHVATDLVVAYPTFLVNCAWSLRGPRPTPDGPVVAYWLEYALGALGKLEAAVVVAVRQLRRSDDG
jgi:hypothetical protein